MMKGVGERWGWKMAGGFVMLLWLLWLLNRDGQQQGVIGESMCSEREKMVVYNPKGGFINHVCGLPWKSVSHDPRIKKKVSESLLFYEVTYNNRYVELLYLLHWLEWIGLVNHRWICYR